MKELKLAVERRRKERSDAFKAKQQKIRGQVNAEYDRQASYRHKLEWEIDQKYRRADAIKGSYIETRYIN